MPDFIDISADAASKWFLASPSSLLWVVLATFAMYVVVVGCTRLAGVRSFAEMTTFDTVVAIAVGSLLATVVAGQKPPLIQGIVAVVTLYILQILISKLRQRWFGAAVTVDNRPILLMGEGGVIRAKNMRVAGVVEDDLRAHLRKNNVSDPREVRAVVMEGTGNIHVLHGDHHQLGENAWILKNVRDYSD